MYRERTIPDKCCLISKLFNRERERNLFLSIQTMWDKWSLYLFMLLVLLLIQRALLQGRIQLTDYSLDQSQTLIWELSCLDVFFRVELPNFVR